MFTFAKWMFSRRTPWLGLLGLLLALDSVRAAEPVAIPPLRIGVYVTAPFVMTGPYGYNGLAVDLWNAVGAKLGRKTEFVRAASLPDLLGAARSGRIDIAVANVFVTAERAEQLSFTQPWFNGGLRILVNEERQIGPLSLLHDLHKLGYLTSYAWLGAGLLLITLLLTLVERRLDKEFPPQWWPGLAISFYHVMAVTTTGKTSHKNLFGSLGTVLAALWMACSVAVMAYVTSTVTSVMTVNSITSRITGLGDLPGKRIGVEAGSLSEDHIARLGLDYRAFPDLDQAVAALTTQEIDAVVDDAATLEYFDQQHPTLPIQVVGKIFEPRKYAFALPLNSPLTHDVTVALLSLEEDQTAGKLRTQYFGADK
ncbi:transporter substrate-binding domain-containing protein [uncultured Pseudomonas sp.]|uniref:transporter substrate-binding domain-containing protein n=1 Tax=uncultured Pseudomonas sp. TaxID=114707 RepID=UPI0025FF7FC4|nr:transporter substrate-binding domain-containing protein [uncultured Pseudomonas sp.]